MRLSSAKHKQIYDNTQSVRRSLGGEWGRAYLVEHARFQSVASFAVACEARVPYIIPLTVVAHARVAWLLGQNLVVASAALPTDKEWRQARQGKITR